MKKKLKQEKNCEKLFYDQTNLIKLPNCKRF